MAVRNRSETFWIKGMTCISCEQRIKRKILKMFGVTAAEVSYQKGTAKVDFNPEDITCDEIVKVIEDLGYIASGAERSVSSNAHQTAIGTMIVFFAVYLILKRFGVLNLFNLFPQAEAGMGYGMLFLIGILTSVHCIAMCGGISLSQCIGCSGSDNQWNAVRPSLLYNLGRVISYTIAGGIVGAIGAVISFTGLFKGMVQLLAGIFMVIMGINMLGIIPWLRRLSFRIPNLFSEQPRENQRIGPLAVGLLNGLMPCGPLQAMQLYALSTGSPVQGAVSMFLFSLGTVPLMFGLGALSTILSRQFTGKMMTAGAVLVVILGGSMFHNGLALAGLVVTPATSVPQQNVAQLADGIQVVETNLSSGRYEAIEVIGGVPVRWVIKADPGTVNGCNNRIFIPEYGIEKRLEVGENVIEFLPEESGIFPYSCWMGMIRSSITVIK